MMQRLAALGILALLCFCLPEPTQALPVKIKSGEHDGFTRLVLDFGHSVDWTLARSLDGYVLHLSEAAPSYDLTEAFTLIGKSRLAAIWADPQSGDLSLGIGCACHAIPFEFRPGVIVIDLKNGPPPAGSSFEMSLDGSFAPVLTAAPLPQPQQKPQAPLEYGDDTYNWMDTAFPHTKSAQVAEPVQLHTDATAIPDPSLQPLRRSLLWQLSEGAAKGVVDMVPPKRSPQPPNDQIAPVFSHFGASEPTNLNTDHPKLAAQGQPCIPDEKLDMASWGDSTPISQQMALHRQNLLGEFDKPDPDALTKAVQFQLFIGFGAEARQTMHAFPVDLPDAALFESLSYLLDDEADPGATFANFSACDGSAALWALLSNPNAQPGDLVSTQAVKLAFSALPPPLRNSLGPRLMERFLARQEPENARAIRDAVLRLPQHDMASMALAQAEMDMHNGDASAAEASISPVLIDPGPQSAHALEAFVEARAAQGLPIKPDVVPALEALKRQTPTGDDTKRLNKALLMAHALSGDFDSAFAATITAPESEPDLWRLLATLAPDDALLAHAVTADDQALPNLDMATSVQIATRLSALGLPVQAERWLNQTTSPPSLLSAQLALAQSEPDRSLRLIAGDQSDEAQFVRIAALRALNDNLELARIYKEAGGTAMQTNAMARAGEWNDLATSGSDPWKAAAASLQPDLVAAPAGPLAEAKRLADASEKTRNAVTVLLDAIPDPASPSQTSP